MISGGRLEPGQAVRLVLGALGGRVSIPLSWLRDRVSGFAHGVALRIAPERPGVRIEGEALVLGAPIRFSARIRAHGVHIEGVSRTIRFRLTDVELSTDDDAPGPLAQSIRDGMIDTRHPATLIGNMIPLPEMIVSAEGEEVVVDLMKLPVFDRDEMRRAVFAAATSYLCVTAIDIADDAIQLQLGLLPGGPVEAAKSTARALLTPVVRYLWTEGRP